jgi:hypothetical protein
MLLLPLPERRQLAIETIKANPYASIRDLSRKTGLSREMVTRHRALLIHQGEIDQDKPMIGSDGKTYRMCQQRLNQHGLMGRIVKLRNMTKNARDELWRSAEPHSRRRLWLAAVELAEALATDIDVTTGEKTRTRQSGQASHTGQTSHTGHADQAGQKRIHSNERI